MAVRTARTAMVKTIDDDIGLEFSNGEHYICQDFIPIPKLKSLFWVFAVSKIVGAGKELLSAISLSSLQELLGTDNAEQLGQFRANKVLASIASSNRKVSCLGVYIVYQI